MRAMCTVRVVHECIFVGACLSVSVCVRMPLCVHVRVSYFGSMLPSHLGRHRVEHFPAYFVQSHRSRRCAAHPHWWSGRRAMFRQPGSRNSGRFNAKAAEPVSAIVAPSPGQPLMAVFPGLPAQALGRVAFGLFWRYSVCGGALAFEALWGCCCKGLALQCLSGKHSAGQQRLNCAWYYRVGKHGFSA